MTEAQRSDVLDYAKRRREALVAELLNERWAGCENKPLQRKLAYLDIIIWGLDNADPTTYLTDSQLDLIYDRIKCIVTYDPAKAQSTTRDPWLTWDSIDWDAWDGAYWALP